MKRLPKNPEATKLRILDAAANAFYGRGIKNVSLDDIAAEAGVTKRTLYYHFASKDDLIARYLRARHPVIFERLVARATKSQGSLREQIEGLFIAMADLASNPDWKGCPFVRAAAELAGTPEHAGLAEASSHKHQFEEWLRERIEAAQLREPELLAKQLMVLLDGTVTQMLVHRDGSYARAAAKAAAILVQQARG